MTTLLDLAAKFKSLRRECMCVTNRKSVVDPPADFDWARFVDLMHRFQSDLDQLDVSIGCDDRGWILPSEAECVVALEEILLKQYEVAQYKNGLLWTVSLRKLQQAPSKMSEGETRLDALVDAVAQVMRHVSLETDDYVAFAANPNVFRYDFKEGDKVLMRSHDMSYHLVPRPGTVGIIHFSNSAGVLTPYFSVRGLYSTKSTQISVRGPIHPSLVRVL